jgi:protein-tyrosine kinase
MSIVERAIVRARSAQSAEATGQAPRTESADVQPSQVAGRPKQQLTDVFANLPRIELTPVALCDAGLSAEPALERRQIQEFRGIKRALFGALGGAQSDPTDSLIAVASALSGEGKTYVSFNLARSLAAQVERNVVLVDADLPKRDLSRALGLAGRPGLGDYLSNRSLTISDVLLSTSVPQLYVLPAGSSGDESAELLASARMRELATLLAATGPETLVVFDSSPILLAPDADSLFSVVGSIVMVIRSMVSQKAEVAEAVRRLNTTKNVLGILNAWEPHGPVKRRYGYEFYGDYGAPSVAAPRE